MLSKLYKENNLIIVNDLAIENISTKRVIGIMNKLEIKDVLFVGCNNNFHFVK